jgi:hypothetical protein
LSLPGVGRSADEENWIIQRIDTASDEVEVFCTLPATEAGTASAGCDARFGPHNSPFAGRFFAATTRSRTIYHVTSDGRSAPFVTFDAENWGPALGIGFTPDGQHMLASLTSEKGGAIARVRPTGEVEHEPLLRSAELGPIGFAYAPAEFGDYAGELFIASFGHGTTDGQPTRAGSSVGSVYRASSQGQLETVATGFRQPIGVHFLRDRLWVCDRNADFMYRDGEWGGRELPDGFVVEMTVTSDTN